MVYPAQNSRTIEPVKTRHTNDRRHPTANPTPTPGFREPDASQKQAPIAIPINGASSIVIPIIGIRMSAVRGSIQSRSIMLCRRTLPISRRRRVVFDFNTLDFAARLHRMVRRKCDDREIIEPVVSTPRAGKVSTELKVWQLATCTR